MSTAEELRCGGVTLKGDFVIEAVTRIVEIPSIEIQRQKKRILFVESHVHKKIVMSLPRVRWLERGL